MPYKFDFSGEINTNNINTLITYIRSIKNLTSDDTLIININSMGGNVSDGIAIYNFLKQLKCKIVTNNLGDVSSAAILLYMAGNIRTASDVSKFMFHPIKMGINSSLNFYQIKELMNNLERDINNYYAIITAELPSITNYYNLSHILKYDSLILGKSDAIACGIITMQ